MRLSQFIVSNTEQILAEFEAFARALAAPGSMDIKALRDHAAEMLAVIADDLETPQTGREQTEKAMGRSDSSEETPDTPAQEHGLGRASSGFTVSEMVSEYRALRASVIRLWSESAGEWKAPDLKDLVRFNEAIDQALAESTERFTDELDRTRDTFLGILGHDLRSPLGAVLTSAQFLVEEAELTPTARKLAVTMLHSGRRMEELVSDLLDLTRSRLSVAMPIVRQSLDLADVLESAVEEMKAARPGSALTLSKNGDLKGQWDEARLRQVLSNLLSNAINHGGAQGPIAVAGHGENDYVVISVHNDGPPIPADKIADIFEPLNRHATASSDPQHMGLGLYITHQIVTAHGGTITVASSSDHGTTFTVRLPNRSRHDS